MSYEIEPYEGGKLDRQARKEVDRSRRSEMVQRAHVDAVEGMAAYEVSVRLANGYHLTAQAQANITSLNANTERTTKDKPGLEMVHRELQENYSYAAGQLIGGYMTRKRRYS